MYGIAEDVIDRVIARQGRLHTLTRLQGDRCALIVVDMQNYFLKPGFQAEVPAARDIVSAINTAARSLRASGGVVVWVQTASNGADSSWTWLHKEMYTAERSERRLAELAEGSEGFALWHGLDALAEDLRVTKRRFSAFIQGSSELEQQLRTRGIDTVLIAGTATNVCCASTAHDAMMLNFKTAMLADANAALMETCHIESLTNFILYYGDVMNVSEMNEMLVTARPAA